MKPARPKRTRQRASARRANAFDAEMRVKLEEILGHTFTDETLLERAVLHPSALRGPSDPRRSYQRLEFLGDRVLGLVIAERLFVRRTHEREGEMAPRLNRLVNKRACADAVRHLKLGEYITMAPNEIRNGGRERDSTLGDVCESIIGALYLDGGLKTARDFIERAFRPQFEAMSQGIKDPKTMLQEWALAEGLGLPNYKTVSRTGPDHAPVFQIEVQIGDDLSAKGTDGSKQDAERRAAHDLLVELGELDD